MVKRAGKARSRLKKTLAAQRKHLARSRKAAAMKKADQGRRYPKRKEVETIIGTGDEFTLSRVTDIVVISLSESLERRASLNTHLRFLKDEGAISETVRLHYVCAKSGKDVKDKGVSISCMLKGGSDERAAAAACTWSHAIACDEAARMVPQALANGVLILEDSAVIIRPWQKFRVPLGYAVSVGHIEPLEKNRDNYKPVCVIKDAEDTDDADNADGELWKRNEASSGYKASSKGYIVTSRRQALELRDLFAQRIGKDYADGILLKSRRVLICDPPMVARSADETTIR
jgi:hypothetical protein